MKRTLTLNIDNKKIVDEIEQEDDLIQHYQLQTNRITRFSIIFIRN